MLLTERSTAQPVLLVGSRLLEFQFTLILELGLPLVGYSIVNNLGP